MLRRDLAPGGGTPLFSPPFPRFPSLAWYVQLVVGLFAISLSAFAWHTLIDDYGVRNEVAGLLGVGQGAAVMLALYWPMAAWWVSLGMAVSASFAAAVSAALSASASGDPVPESSVWPAPSLVLHVGVLALVAWGTRPRVPVEMWLITLGVGVVLAIVLPGNEDPLSLIDMTVLSGTVLIAAGALRSRSEALRRVARAEQATGEEQARRALLEERTRIARELHDVVAHHMTVIAIQAEAAPYRVAETPAELARSFAVIRAGALEALTELQRVLGLLRSDAVDKEPESPQPTLERIHDLIEGVREAGLNVVLCTEGTPSPIPQGVGLSAYRIVQEALSNVLRHAFGADVVVQVVHRPGHLELHVVNGPGRTSPQPTTGMGHGLLGLRERTAMLGGELTAGPRGGGYVVHACLPLHGGDDA
ncbi:sensor histidine kinase [Sinosporangium album]|uniref:sensor histidine kinase n=1 Tax=Sinosporangium album TaxID=504805 RepID=UPI0015A380CF|nr:histidine kinase [Sinosporangium album]